MKNNLISLITAAWLLLLPGLAIGQADSAKATAPTGTDCMQCHSQEWSKKLKHKTETEKGCADCHQPATEPHPDSKIALVNKVPDLCLSCHEEQKDLLSSAKYVHTGMKNPKSCIACHSPHSSDVKKLLVAKRREVCLSCHNKPVGPDKQPMTNYAQLMKSRTLHPPFEDCQTVCHNPHASNDARLIDGAFPVGTYLVANSDSFGLCWECHAQDMIEKPKTKGSTEFRDGETNLHYVHVSGNKARSCMVCHNPHATETDHLVREQVKFGSWNFNMNFTPSDSGGSCLPACHGQKTYIRKSAGGE